MSETRRASGPELTVVAPLEQLQLLLTERCNLRCTHCAVPEEDSPADHELSLHEWTMFVSRVLDAGVKRIVLSGGEALLRRECLQIAEHSLRQGADAVIIVTNGTVMQRSTTEPLAALQQRWPNLLLHVSLDGATAASHDLIRGSGTFDRTMAGLDRLAAEGGGVAGVHTVLHQANFCELDALVAMVRRLGAASWTVFPVASLGRGRELDGHRLVESQWREVLQYLASGAVSGLEVGLMGPTMGDEWRSTDAVPQARGTHSGQAVVGPDGEVFACPPLRDSAVGNVSAIRRGDDWADVDRALRAEIEPVCPTCKFRPLCTGVHPGEPLVEPVGAFRHPGGSGPALLPLTVGSR